MLFFLLLLLGKCVNTNIISHTNSEGRKWASHKATVYDWLIKRTSLKQQLNNGSLVKRSHLSSSLPVKSLTSITSSFNFFFPLGEVSQSKLHLNHSPMLEVLDLQALEALCDTDLGLWHSLTGGSGPSLSINLQSEKNTCLSVQIVLLKKSLYWSYLVGMMQEHTHSVGPHNSQA